MDFNYFNSFEVESHPFETSIPNNSKTIIVGTFPTHQKNRLFEWYYGGEGNRFWKVIEGVLEHTFTHDMKNRALEERQEIMNKYGIAMTDMVKRCYRKNTLSQDHHLFPIELTDLIELLNKNQSIDTVIFTSRTKVIGALGLFETLLHQKNLQIPKMTNRQGMLEGWLPLHHADISLLVPYSPSKTLSEKDFANTDKLISMYKSCSLKRF